MTYTYRYGYLVLAVVCPVVSQLFGRGGSVDGANPGAEPGGARHDTLGFWANLQYASSALA